MKFSTTLLPLAAISTAFVIPDERLTTQIVAESNEASKTWLDRLSETKDDVFSQVEEKFESAKHFSENALDNAIQAVSEAGEKAYNMIECHHSMTKFDTQGWLDSALATVEDVDIFDHGHHDKPPHHGPPHHGPPHHGPPHHGHGKPNLTVYQLISSSKYTTKFTKLIDHFPEIVDLLNSTKANYTVFAPTDKAFEKFPDHPKHKPSEEILRAVLGYHISDDFYPAGRVLASHTIPTVFLEKSLGDKPQRLRVGLGLKGLAVNFYSRIVAINIFGTNGVIHGVDSLLLPPPPALKIVELLPGEFSTLQLGLEKTGLFDAIAASNNTGGTLFAPSNWAFQKLGPKINAFLFSKYGQKYLKALLKYHVVANQTLYSDAFYKAKTSEDLEVVDEISIEGIPKGYFHVDLPTLLEEKSLSIDVARYGGLISIKINGFVTVSVQDGIAKDGVIHVLSSVLIPPKTPGGEMWAGEELEVDDLKERLSSFVDENEELIYLARLTVEEHFDDFWEIWRDERALLWSTQAPKLTREDALELMMYVLPAGQGGKEEGIDKFGVLLRGVEGEGDAGLPKMIGFIGTNRPSPQGLEFGYCFNYEYWGKGYATEATRMFLDVYWGLEVAKVDPDNIASLKIVERIGGRKGEVLKEVS
ncbi:fasciclin domain family protein [Rutstroemia sp. NJR-2017a BVV2]|nr:fasciclin domain family protein [Rutstroemia sp. NJR-2017a BVV2]